MSINEIQIETRADEIQTKQKYTMVKKRLKEKLLKTI